MKIYSDMKKYLVKNSEYYAKKRFTMTEWLGEA